MRTNGTDVPSVDSRMMGDQADLDRLENAKPFDRAFIEEMVPHHRMAQMLLKTLIIGKCVHWQNLSLKSK